MPASRLLDRMAYFQRSGPPGGTGTAVLRLATPALIRVLGVGVEEKHALSPRGPAADTGERAAGPDEARPPLPPPPTAQLLTGLVVHRMALAFRVSSDGRRAAFEIGLCPPGGTDPADPRLRGTVRSALHGAYPHVGCGPGGGGWRDTAVDREHGLVLGVPAPAPPGPGDAAAPWDRILRAMTGQPFQVLVLAVPVDERRLAAVREGVLAEARDVASIARATGLPLPEAEHYTRLLTTYARQLAAGLAVGAWRTAVYLSGAAGSYAALKSVFRGTFAAEADPAEPVRVYNARDAGAWAQTFALPEAEPPAGPGVYRRPYEWQTLLNSRQLSAYLHFPSQEHPGFSVEQAARFDVARAVVPPERHPLWIGDIRYGAVDTPEPYAVALDDLTRHAFVTGVTGAGKSHTMRHLLRQVSAAGLPFLVVEPAKAEYRALLHEVPGLTVYTCGDETVNPPRLNPLEVPEGVPLGVHLDMLRSLFTAAFALWSPLPQLLDRALHELYAEHGLDVHGSAAVPADAFPTLSDLRGKVDSIIDGLGYSGEVVSNMRAALLARLDGLRTGGKGRMLDVPRSTGMADLFERPVVVELERLGDEDDQAFVMGLVMIRLWQYRWLAGAYDGLRHVLVVEEAHRLLAADAPQARPDAGVGGARAKAVAAFTNILAELRSYGQAIVVADQIPAKLAPEVVKNTELKIVHRLVAADDRTALGQATAMSEAQIRSLATFDRGVAAVFSRGDDAPVQVRIPAGPSPRPLDAAGLRAHLRRLGIPPPAHRCEDRCVRGDSTCDIAVRMAGLAPVAAAFALFAQSAAVDPGAGRRAYPDLLVILGMHLPRDARTRARTRRCTLLRLCLDWATRRGRAAGWTHSDTTAVADGLVAAVRALDAVADARPGTRHDDAVRGAAGDEADAGDAALAGLGAVLSPLAVRRFDPFPACRVICPDGSCHFHEPVREEIISARHRDAWSRVAGAGSLQEREQSYWSLAYAAVDRCAVSPRGLDLPEVKRLADRAAMCAVQQSFHTDPEVPPHVAATETAMLLRDYAVTQEEARS
ncbi:ATP-binding protein [Plantactinospora sp. CA-290183]|uniref:ATP-binding protein n=1 Tax=Plantactinospora sp. CA-290183 TaxID=3240006 RepID=UPI003D89E899